MAELPDNYIEILTYLADNRPDGLTSSEILAKAKAKRYHNFRDINAVSAAVYAVRGKKLLTTSDSSSNRKHTITKKGLELLEKATGIKTPELNPAPAMPAAKIADEIVSSIQIDPDQTTLIDTLNDNVSNLEIVYTNLKKCLTQIHAKPAGIDNKTTKLSVLTRLADIHNAEIAGVLDSIAEDIKGL